MEKWNDAGESNHDKQGADGISLRQHLHSLSNLRRATLLANGGRCVAYGEGGKTCTWASSTGQPTLRLNTEPGQVYMAGGAMVFTVRPSVHRVGLR